MKKTFQRTCMGCNTKKDKYELIRIVRTKDNKAIVDSTGKMEGRGAYICSRQECLDKVIKTNRIFKVLKINTDKKIYENIRGVIIDKASTN